MIGCLSPQSGGQDGGQLAALHERLSRETVRLAISAPTPGCQTGKWSSF